MSEDAADALEGAIEEAKAAGNIGRANDLYQRQLALEAGVPVVSQEPAPAEDDVAPQTGAGEVVVAVNAEDEIATISGGLDFAGDPDHVAHALEAMSVWDYDENGELTGGLVDNLKANWGSDLGANLGYFQSFALAHPDVYEILVASGFGDHPAIIEAGAMLGRAYVTKSGDPSRVTTRKAGVNTMDNMATNQIEARIDTLQDEIDAALAKNDHGKAQKKYLLQQALYGRLPGGSEPIVGSQGRTA